MFKRGVVPPLLLGFSLGALSSAAVFWREPEDMAGGRGEIHLGQREFVNPLVDCPSRPRGFAPKKADLQNLLNGMIRDFEKSGEVEEVAVLFRDLNNGPGLAINAKEPFIAASLLKLPILAAFFKKRSSEPTLFDRKLRFDQTTEFHLERIPTIQPSFPNLQHGVEYTVGELLARMIVDSDNIATAMLMRAFPEVNISQSLMDMGIPITMKGDELWINVEDYAAIFRILYNATYLGQDASNAALAMMSKSTFDVGLEAGVEPNIVVSHKFGEREVGVLQQLHDCGIVYYPLRPFLLCVMTRGSQQKALINAIAQISKAVFQQVKKDSEVH